MRKNINKVTLNFLRKNKFDNIQCNFSAEEKSTLIYTILAGIPIPLIITEEKNDKLFVFSGGSVIATILQFIRGEFSLLENTMLDKLITEEVQGKSFFDFTDELKEEFLETEMAISVFRPPLTDAERNAVVSIISKTKGNPGLSIPTTLPKESTLPKTEIKATVSKSIEEQLEDLMLHPFFEKVNISPLTIDIAVQLFMVSNDGAVSDLSAKKIIEFKDNLDKLPDIRGVLDYLDNAFIEKTTYLKKAHLPMIFNVARNALADNVATGKFKGIIDDFFAMNNVMYKKACDNGTASKSNVNTRIRIMLEFYSNFN